MGEQAALWCSAQGKPGQGLQHSPWSGSSYSPLGIKGALKSHSLLPQKHITWFLLFSPVPVCLNAQAEPLGCRVLETALKQFITQNILELKEKKIIILILSDQKGNWGAATYVFGLASVWAWSNGIFKETCRAIPNSTVDHFNVHSCTLHQAASCPSDNPHESSSDIIVLQMPFSPNGLLSSNNYSEKSGRQGQAAAEWKVKTWKMLDEYLCRAIFTLTLWRIMGSAKLTEFTLRAFPLWELSLICT